MSKGLSPASIVSFLLESLPEQTIRRIMQKSSKNKYDKRKFYVFFAILVIVAAVARRAFSVDVPYNVGSKSDVQPMATDSLASSVDNDVAAGETVKDVSDTAESEVEESEIAIEETIAPKAKNKIVGVYSFDKCFPDINDVQLEAARQNGIAPVENRDEAQVLVDCHKLVNISNSPYYCVDELSHSMPYLVPKAQHVLNTICLNFIDSLQAKGLPPHLPMVTSVLRTVDDVFNLRGRNKNATVNSCHCYGTTVDISYNRYVPVIGRYEADHALTKWSYEMKCVLSEVLYDLRNEGVCYVKYEKKQGCFHLTVR